MTDATESIAVQQAFSRATPQHQYDALQALAGEYWEAGFEYVREADNEEDATTVLDQYNEIITACELLQEALIAAHQDSERFSILEGVAPF